MRCEGLTTASLYSGASRKLFWVWSPMPFIQQGEIANLPSYSYYVRISAVTAQEPMSGVTVVVEEQGDESIARRVIELSRELYAKKIKEARENIKVQGRSIPKAPTTKKTGRQEEDDLLSAISVS